MSTMDKTIMDGLSQDLGLALKGNPSEEELTRTLAGYIEELIHHDFNKLLTILYRVDVPEKTLKAKIEESPDNASLIIAGMLIRRQVEKKESRERFRDNRDIDEEEKW